MKLSLLCVASDNDSAVAAKPSSFTASTVGDLAFLWVPLEGVKYLFFFLSY